MSEKIHTYNYDEEWMIDWSILPPLPNSEKIICESGTHILYLFVPSQDLVVANELLAGTVFVFYTLLSVSAKQKSYS